MSTEKKMHVAELSVDERLEYEHLSHWGRHDDTMIYQAASTVLPLAFGAVAIAVQFPKMVIPLALFSIVLYVYWLLIATRLSWFSSVRLHRMRELENKACLGHHVILSNPPLQLQSILGSRISIRKVRWLGLIVLATAWLVTLVQLVEPVPKTANPRFERTAPGVPASAAQAKR